MAGPASGDALSSNIAGMSKNQLYDIMSQMKVLIEQNQPQARQILIQNPLLTRALFQAQIMLGMVQPPKVIPTIQPTVSKHPPQAVQPSQQPNVQASQSMAGQVDLQDQTTTSQIQVPEKKQHQSSHRMMPVSSAAAPTASPRPLLHPAQVVQHSKGLPNAQLSSVTLPHSSQTPFVPPTPLPPPSQPLALKPTTPSPPAQLQQSSQTSGFPHLPVQPPLPPQARPSSMPTFNQNPTPQIGSNTGFGAPHMHHSQSMFHSGSRPAASIGPSYQQGQSLLPSQPPPQSLYQQQQQPPPGDRGGSSWMPSPGLAENAMRPQLSGPPPPPVVPGQAGPGSQATRPPPPLTPEMEKALLQQVMSLTPEQINFLPPEQRNQVLQLQQMLRQ